MEQRVSEIRDTHCPLDCPDACSLSAEVVEGRLVSLDGDYLNPVTGGFICGKVRHFPELVYGSDRVLEPLERVGRKGSGEFRPIPWEEALDRAVEAIHRVRARWGGEGILPCCYGGSNGFLTQNTLDARLFRRLGASRIARTVCAAPSGAAAAGLYGKMPGVSYEDYPLARLIIVWGANPSATGVHLVPYIKQAQRKGARLVVVDPRATPLARAADLHLALRPGTDLPVALSLIDWLFRNGRADLRFLEAHASGVDELRQRAWAWPISRAATEAGLREHDLETLVQWYADSSPALIRCGWGPERNRNGGSAIAAVLALPAVAGKFGVAGGGFTMSNSGAWDLHNELAIAEPEPPTRLVNSNQLGEALSPHNRPPVGLLYVYNGNPLATFTAQEKIRRGLEREDLFTIVHEQVMTDTARYADLVLPATTFLEHHELHRGYGALTMQAAGPVIQPVGQARSNIEVCGELLRRLGLERPGDPKTAAELQAALLASSLEGERIAAELTQIRRALPAGGDRPVQFQTVFPRTADRRVHLFPAALDAEAPAGLYGYQADPGGVDYPLALISPASGQAITSTLYQLVKQSARLKMHPGDAAARGIGDEDTVRIFNAQGEVICGVVLTDEVRPGVVELPKGLWARHTRNGRTANALVPDTLTDLGGGACFNDARVEVARHSVAD